MNKVFGLISEYAPVREEGTRTVISYGMTAVDEQNATWYEIYLSKKQNANVGLKEIKDAIIADINSRTDEKIISGFVWTPEGGDPINVWLSKENQFNYAEADRKAPNSPSLFPLTFKLGENENNEPVYYTFQDAEELQGFYDEAFGYIQTCLSEGWQEKDGMDWTPYEALFPTPTNNNTSE